MGGSPSERPQRYGSASPIRLVPHRGHVVLMHGTEDDAVPIAQSIAYAKAAKQAGGRVTFVELEGAGHMDFLDPASVAHRKRVDGLDGTWLR